MSSDNMQWDYRPRLLFLHGGGVTGEIYRVQCRSLLPRLSAFRPVFTDGPYLCGPGPGIETVYADHGPFRRWLRWLPEHEEVDRASAIDEIGYQLRSAMQADDADGGRGDWVGVVGFSQGAKVAASVLFEQQVREEVLASGQVERGSETWRHLVEGGELNLGRKVHWSFGVLMAGRPPLVSLGSLTDDWKYISMADAATELHEKSIDGVPERCVLRVPTVHIHGLKDPGLNLHRQLYDFYSSEDSRTLVEWNGDHRIPLKKADVEKVAKAVMEIAEKTGVVGGCA